MPKSFFYSIDLLIRSAAHLNDAIASLVADEEFFLENVQLILIDTLCSEETLDICTLYNKKFPENICFVDAAGKSDASAYNDAASLNSGHYVAFIDNYGEYSPKTLRTLRQKTLSTGVVPLLCVAPFAPSSDNKPAPYECGIQSGIVKLKETPDKFVLILGCWFFRRRIADTLSFDESLPFQSEVKYITEALVQTYSYIFTDQFRYTTAQPCDNDAFRYKPQYHRAFYTPSVELLMIPLLEAHPASPPVQSIITYLICKRFALNTDEKYKHVIIGSYVDGFLDKVSEALRYIDNSVILNRSIYRYAGLDEEMAFRLLRLKYRQTELKPAIDLVLPKESIEKSYVNPGMKPETLILSGEFAAHYDRALIGRSKEISADISAINYDSEGLYIDAVLNGCSYLDPDSFSIFVNINGEREPVISSEVYTLRKCFDVPFLKRYSFRFFVPVSSGKKIDNVFLLMKYRNLSFRTAITFGGIFARLAGDIKTSYWHFSDRVMTYDRKSRSIYIRRATNNLLRISEGKFMGEAGSGVSMQEAVYYRQLRRNVRTVLSEKADTRILLFYDETGINSNGNVLFRYFSDHLKDERIELYYASKRGTDEYEYLAAEEYSGLLELGSKKCKLIASCADVIFATDCDVYESLMFDFKDILFLKDLINASIVSVKNFFMTYGSAQFDNRLRDNTQLFFCASDREKEHIMRNVYDYDESMIRVTGYPILDTLNDEKEKLILIAPGDRRQFCIYENSDLYRFSETRFFRFYNELLSDKELHSALEENSYRIAVLMPYSIKSYISLFHTDELVTVFSPDEKNEAELVRKAAVLLTDHSDLQYRFAYLDKPIVYYFPHGLPVQREYKEEGLAKNSFGRLFFDRESLVAHLIAEMKKDFPQEEVYSKMRSGFFRYLDRNNCRRILHSIKSTLLSDIFEK